MPLTLQDGDMALIRHVLILGYTKIKAGDCVLPDQHGKEIGRVSFVVKMFYEGIE